MWILKCISALCFVAAYSETAAAYYSSFHNTSLVSDIKPNPSIRSKPTPEFIKLAWVSFIVDDNRRPINFLSREAMQCIKEGYSVKSCPGQLPGDICPYEPNYMNGCCALDYKYENGDACVYPLSQDKEACGGKYRCYCDRAKFPYETSYVCENPKILSSETCTYNNETYHTDCVCPAAYSELCPASDHLVSKGESCSYGGKEYYTGCACESGYNLSCDVVGPQNPSDYCLLNGVRYYNNCKSYEENEEIKFNYTGDVQSVSLPAGKYKFQVWGAQGGGSSGSKGGYSEGTVSFDTSTTFYLFIGGQGGSTQGGWNGGGGSTGYSSYSSGGTNGYSYPYAGGGGSDIALINSSVTYSGTRTTRDTASLLSRIIVAGGGGGYSSWSKRVTTSSTSTRTIATCSGTTYTYGVDKYYDSNCSFSTTSGNKYSMSASGCSAAFCADGIDCTAAIRSFTASTSGSGFIFFYNAPSADTTYTGSVKETYTTSSTSSSSGNGSSTQQGGGSSGLGQYPGTQTAAGSGSYAGAFGLGASQTVTNYRYASGAGGGGWYGGGAAYSDSSTSYVNYSGGGSGFVYTAGATVPSGYSVPTAYQLTDAVTKAGNVSFPSTSGGTETGHAGNGYIKITALEQYQSSEVAKECDLSKYVLEGIDPVAGSYQSCNDAAGSHYYYTACNDGWTLSNGLCKSETCSGFDSADEDIAYCETVASCQSGAKTFYTCTQCTADHLYDSMSGQCLCVDAPFADKPDESLGAVKTCVDAEGTKYGYTECYDGRIGVFGDCVEDTAP